MELEYSETQFSIYQFSRDSELGWEKLVAGGSLFSMTQTDDEISVVGPSEQLAKCGCAAANVSEGWCGLRVVGKLDFSQIGILRDLSSCLASAEISIFAMSTFDTDYLLIRAIEFERAKLALQKSGYRLKPSTGW